MRTGTARKLRVALVSLVIGGLVLPGCSEEAPEIRAAKAFALAVQARNVEQLLTLVDGETVAYVEHAAERASDQIGGRRSVGAAEMLQVADIDARFGVVRAEVLESATDTARVRLVGADGSEHDLDLRLEGGEWKVVLTPPAVPKTAGAAKAGEPS